MPNFLADTPPPAPLPAPPAWEAWLLESLVTGPGVLLLALLVGLAMLPRVDRARLGLVVAGIGAGLGLALLAWSVLTITPREALATQTRDLVASIARGESEPARVAFAPDVRLTLLGTNGGLTRDQMLARISGEMNGRYAVVDRAVRIRRLLASIDGPNSARTQCRVEAVHEATRIPASTWWILHWRRAAGGGPWQVVNLELQQFDGLPPGTRIQP